MHGIVHSARSAFADRVARFVRPLEDGELLSTVPEHLGHKGKLIESTAVVERTENFFFAPNLNNFISPKIKHEIMIAGLTSHRVSFIRR
jgi:hypothetical protein